MQRAESAAQVHAGASRHGAGRHGGKPVVVLLIVVSALHSRLLSPEDVKQHVRMKKSANAVLMQSALPRWLSR